MAECKLGMVGVCCPGVNRGNSECTVYASGIDVRMERGHCEYMAIHAPRVGIHDLNVARRKKVNKVNPIKASKRGG